MPMAEVAKPSDCARTPSRVDCRPAPSIRMPMPSSSGQVLANRLAGMGIGPCGDGEGRGL